MTADEYWLCVDDNGVVHYGASDEYARERVNEHINEVLMEGGPLLHLKHVVAVPLHAAPSVLPDMRATDATMEPLCTRCNGARRVPTFLGRPENCPACCGGQDLPKC